MNAHLNARRTYFRVRDNNFNTDDRKYLVLPFIEKSSDINNMAKAFNISIVNRSNSILKSILKK